MFDILESVALRTYFEKVQAFFNGDENKTILWFQTPNPNLGGIAPVTMIALGREHKLYKFIDTALSENQML